MNVIATIANVFNQYNYNVCCVSNLNAMFSRLFITDALEVVITVILTDELINVTIKSIKYECLNTTRQYPINSNGLTIANDLIAMFNYISILLGA